MARKEHCHNLYISGFSDTAPMYHVFRCLGRACRYNLILPCEIREALPPLLPGESAQCGICEGAT